MKHTSRFILMFIVVFSVFSFQNCSQSDKSQSQELESAQFEVGEQDAVRPLSAKETPYFQDHVCRPPNDGKFRCDAENIKDIQINVLEAYAGETKVSILTGIRSLIDMSNGFNLVFTEPVSTNKIRLILGSDGNQVIDFDMQAFELKTPSAQRSGLKIKLDRIYNFSGNTAYTIKFNLDPEFQVVGTRNKCILKPVLRATSIEEVEF